MCAISDAFNESLRLVGERREEGILTPTSYSSGKQNLKTQKIQKYLDFPKTPFMEMQKYTE